MVLLFCGVRLGVGGELLGVYGWGNAGWEGMGDWCLACGGDGGWRFSGRRMWIVKCFGPFPILPVPLLSLYFPYPSDQLSPLSYFPYPLYKNDTHAPTAWCWELLFYVTPSGWLLISPLKCFWPVCWTVSGQSSGLLGTWPVLHALGYGSWVGICHSRRSFPYNGSWWLRNTCVSRKLLGGRTDVIALNHPKADVPPVSNWRSCLIVAETLHFEMVVSAGKVADLQRVGMLSSLGEFSISWYRAEPLSETVDKEICYLLNSSRE